MSILFLSILAGVCGTGLGGLITALFGAKSSDMSCVFLSFAAGIMTGIVCFGLVPEALGISPIFTVLGGLAAGILVIMLLNRLVDHVTSSERSKLKMHKTPQELYHEEDLIQTTEGSGDNSALLRSGIIMFLAIGLHNFPEGMAIGAGGVHDVELGFMLALMIALHNIPEGMAIAAPLISGGMNKLRVVILTMLSGVPTVLGAILGMVIGQASDIAIALALSGAGGAMLYVVFGEIIPQAITLRKDRVPTIITLIGMLAGLLLTAM